MNHSQSKTKNKAKNWIGQTLIYLVIVLFISGIALIKEEQTPLSPLKSNEAAHFYSNELNDDLTKVILSGINEANESILLVVYTLTDPNVINALNKKSHSGVSVEVVCDGKAASKTHSKLHSDIKLHHIYPNKNGIMHQKFLVVAQKKIWAGSANMTSHSLKMHGNLIIAFHSEEIAKQIKNNTESIILNQYRKPIPNIQYPLGPQTIELIMLPSDRYGYHKIINLIHSAKKSISIAMFTWTRMDFAEALIQALFRGVKIEVVIDHNAGNGSSSKIVRLLSKAHVPTSLSQSTGLLHYKLLYIDEEILVSGSANWTKAAFTKNDDFFLILSPLTEDQRNFMNRLLKRIHAESKKVK